MLLIVLAIILLPLAIILLPLAVLQLGLLAKARLQVVVQLVSVQLLDHS